MSSSLPVVKDGWQSEADRYWQQGDHQRAINFLLGLINLTPERPPRNIAMQLVYYIFLIGDMRGAEHFLRRLADLYTQDGEILENLAVCLSRSGQHEEAISFFRSAAKLSPDSANIFDGLAHSMYEMGRIAEAMEAGERSLLLKTNASQPLPGWNPPPMSPQEWLDLPRSIQRKNVISFALWGSNPRYLRGALRNALLIPDIYQGWQARFYLDRSVPSTFRQLLLQLGAELRLMDSGQKMRQKLCWRFLVANDLTVARFLVRDCDSVVNLREVEAVNAWIQSQCWFHVMRDWWTHTDPILAGMWGGVAGILPDLQLLLQGYTPKAKETANIDQWFLRDVLWGSIRSLALVHDRCYRVCGSHPWPSPPPAGSLHVGQDEFSTDRQRQASRLAAWIRIEPCLQLAGEPTLDLFPRPESCQQEVLCRFPGPLCPDPAPPMPDQVQGWVINLADRPDRWQRMQEQLERLGWCGTHRRFPACSASEEEARSLGLASAGQLGLWRSTVALLQQWLASDPGADAILHLVEDDAVLHPALPLVLEPFRACPGDLHMLFTEAFLSDALHRLFRVLEDERIRAGDSLLLLNGGLYLACASSVLLTRSGAQLLLNHMLECERTTPLPISDMLIRQLIRSGRLRAALVAPFLSTIEADENSSIQNNRQFQVRLSQNSDILLRRLFYHRTWEPERCRDDLNELAKLLALGLLPEQIETLALEIIQTCRSHGWLVRY